jgi:Protein of unknown function (DUF1460)
MYSNSTSAPVGKCQIWLKQGILLFCLSLLSLQIHANIHPMQKKADATISKLYHSLEHLPKGTMSARIETISSQFLGKKYLLGALGEGIDARFDQDPLYRTDAFDCETYVTTVLALALANNSHGFQQCIRKIHYQDGKVGFITRNHFTSLDWNPNNQRQGFLKDITETFKDKNNQAVAQIANALIDKPGWYQHFSSNIIRLHVPNEKEQTKRLAELKTLGSKLPKINAQIPYIPLTALFDSQGKPNQHLFAQIPHAAIIEIVRPNWKLRDKIGTNLNVSHMGFAFWKSDILFYRQACQDPPRVIDVPLTDYLQKTLTSPTIRGINIQVVVPQHALSDDCQ